MKVIPLYVYKIHHNCSKHVRVTIKGLEIGFGLKRKGSVLDALVDGLEFFCNSSR